MQTIYKNKITNLHYGANTFYLPTTTEIINLPQSPHNTELQFWSKASWKLNLWMTKWQWDMFFCKYSGFNPYPANVENRVSS